jgi:hypothetical protein
MFVARGIASALWLIAKGYTPSEAIIDNTGRVDYVFADVADADRNRVLGPFLDAKDQLRLLSNAAARKAVAS